jgi:hypothetical protein
MVFLFCAGASFSLFLAVVFFSSLTSFTSLTSSFFSSTTSIGFCSSLTGFSIIPSFSPPSVLK